MIAHLQFYYGDDGFVPGQSAIVTVRLQESVVASNGAFPDVAIEAIEVTYRERELRLLGLSLDWMVAFFAMSLLFSWLLRFRFGVVL